MLVGVLRLARVRSESLLLVGASLLAMVRSEIPLLAVHHKVTVHKNLWTVWPEPCGSGFAQQDQRSCWAPCGSVALLLNRELSGYRYNFVEAAGLI